MDKDRIDEFIITCESLMIGDTALEFFKRNKSNDSPLRYFDPYEIKNNEYFNTILSQDLLVRGFEKFLTSKIEDRLLNPKYIEEVDSGGKFMLLDHQDNSVISTVRKEEIISIKPYYFHIISKESGDYLLYSPKTKCFHMYYHGDKFENIFNKHCTYTKMVKTLKDIWRK